MAGPWEAYQPAAPAAPTAPADAPAAAAAGPWAQFAPQQASASGVDADGYPLAPASPTTPASQQPTAQAAPQTDAPMSGADRLRAQVAQPSQALDAVGDVVTSPGLQRGFADVADTIARPIATAAKWVDDRVPALAQLDQTTGLDPTAKIAGMDQARSDYEQQHGSDPVNQAGRVIGQVVGTAPLMGLGGRALAAGGEAIAGAAPTAAAPTLQGIGQFVTGAGEGSLPMRVASQATAGAGQGAAVSGLTSSQSDAPVLDQMKQGAEMGAIAAPIANAVGNGATRLSNFATGTSSVDPARAALAQTARDQFGIQLTAPQISDSAFLKLADSQSQKLPFSGAQAAATGQQEQFVRAVAQDMGETADRITPPVMDAARARIGNAFDSVAAQSSIRADNQFLNDLSRIHSDVAQAPLGDGGQRAIQAQLGNIVQSLQQGGGTIGGDAYQTLTRRGAPLDRALQGADPNVRFYAGQIRDALDDALERSLPPGSPLLPQLQQARQQWRTMRTIEPLVEKSTDGLISPTLLMGAVRSAPGSIAYGSGGGNLGALARIGQAFFKAPPDSGTATRTMVDKAVTGGAAGLGSLAAGSINPLAALGAVGGTAGALYGNRMLGSYMRGPGLANRLINAGMGVPAAPGLLTQAAPYAAPVATAVNGRINAMNGPPANALLAAPGR